MSNLGSYERSTILWLLLGGFAFGIGWIIGLAQLWNSASWKWFDKLLGTLLWPGGLATGVFLFALGIGGSLWIVLGLVVPFATAGYLALRAA